MKHQKFKEATKGMTPAKKREYIWDYYKLPIITTLIVLGVGIYSFYAFGNRMTAYLNVVFTVGDRSQQNLDELQAYLDEALIPEEKQDDYLVSIRPMNFNAVDFDANNPEEVQALMVLLAVGEIDVLVVDVPAFEHFARIESIRPLDGQAHGFQAEDVVYVDGVAFGLWASAFPEFAPIVGNFEAVVAFGLASERTEALDSFLNHAR